MKLIIDIPLDLYERCKRGDYELFDDSVRTVAIANGTPYNSTGDLINREDLKKYAIPCQIHNGASTNLCVPLYQIDNAPPVPQVTVFTENADEKAVADLKAELQNVIEARPNEQIAWEQGYEAGLAQGKHESEKGGAE